MRTEGNTTPAFCLAEAWQMQGDFAPECFPFATGEGEDFAAIGLQREPLVAACRAGLRGPVMSGCFCIGVVDGRLQRVDRFLRPEVFTSAHDLVPLQDLVQGEAASVEQVGLR